MRNSQATSFAGEYVGGLRSFLDQRSALVLSLTHQQSTICLKDYADSAKLRMLSLLVVLMRLTTINIALLIIKNLFLPMGHHIILTIIMEVNLVTRLNSCFQGHVSNRRRT